MLLLSYPAAAIVIVVHAHVAINYALFYVHLPTYKCKLAREHRGCPRLLRICTAFSNQNNSVSLSLFIDFQLLMEEEEEKVDDLS